MKKEYRIVAKNFPADLVQRVSQIHAFALLSQDGNEDAQKQHPPDGETEPGSDGAPLQTENAETPQQGNSR